MRRNKGITLIALIITIIILLILVGVSLNLVIKGDLFGNAEKAVTGTNEKVEQEQSRVDELMGKLNEINEKQAEHNWKKNGDNISCKHCNLSLKIGQEVKYQDTGATSTTITAEKTGYTSDQTIEKGTDVKWVVFGVEDTNKDGVNEALLIIMVEPTETGIAWGNSSLEYNNGTTELNRMCRELYGNNARSITMDDINSALEYKPQGAEYMKPNDESIATLATTGNFTTKVNELEIWNDIKECTVETDTAEKYADYIYNGYFYNINNNGKIETSTGEVSNYTVSDIMENIIFGTEGYYLYSTATKMISAGSYSTGTLKNALTIELAKISGFGRYIGSEYLSVISNRVNHTISTLNDNSEMKTLKAKRMSLVQPVINTVEPSKYKMRAVVTLTGKIPEVGEVITQYGKSTASSDSGGGSLIL